MRFNKKNKDGFTLVELIIVLAILIIVISGGFSLYMFSSNALKKGETQSDVQHQTRLASLYITNEIRTAETVTLFSAMPSPVSGRSYIYVSGNTIKHRKKDGTVVDVIKTVSSSLQPQLVFSRAGDRMVSFTVTTVLNGQTYNVSSQVSPLNIKKDDKILPLSTSNFSVIEYTNPTLDDAGSVRLDHLLLDLSKQNAFLIEESDKSLTLLPPAYHPNVLYLPTKGEYNSNIEWESSNESIIKPDGTVVRPNYTGIDANVVLTAKLTKGVVTTPSSKVFNLNIKKLEPLSFKTEDLNNGDELPVAVLGQPYKYVFNSIGGQPIYTFEAYNIRLADFGLTLTSDGILQGNSIIIPEGFTSSEITILVSVKDDSIYNNSIIKNFKLTISNVTTP